MLPKTTYDRGAQPRPMGDPAAPPFAPAENEKRYEECPNCRVPVFDLIANGCVCPRCGWHFRFAARRRIYWLVDEDSFQETDRDLVGGDPLGFPGYAEKLDRARAASGESEAVITGVARLGGLRCGIFVMNPAFMMGSMGTAVGEKITRLFELATGQRLPVIGFTVSGGARMQEGILSLMQMEKTSAAVRRHSEAGLLYIAVLTDPTTGGVTASFAMEADITLAEPGALIAFAGPRVIQQTIHSTLPEGFQRSEFLLEHGFVDRICDRREQRALLTRLLKLHAAAQPG